MEQLNLNIESRGDKGKGASRRIRRAGNRGRRLLNGETQLKMLGRYVQVKAEVVNVQAFSVHADQTELVGWLRTAPHPPETVHVVHGDPDAAEALRAAIVKELGWSVTLARYLQTVRL